MKYLFILLPVFGYGQTFTSVFQTKQLPDKTEISHYSIKISLTEDSVKVGNRVYKYFLTHDGDVSKLYVKDKNSITYYKKEKKLIISERGIRWELYSNLPELISVSNKQK